MEDNNKSPNLGKIINDDFESNEILDEKPYYDNGSNPSVQKLVDINPTQIQNTNNNPESNDIPDNLPSSDGTQERCCCCCSDKIFLMFLSTILIIIVFTDVGLEIKFKYFGLFLLFEDILLLTMAIIYIVFTIKGKPVINQWIGTPTVLLWLPGIFLRIMELAKLREGFMFGVELIAALIRFIDLLFCVTLTCRVQGVED